VICTVSLKILQSHSRWFKIIRIYADDEHSVLYLQYKYVLLIIGVTSWSVGLHIMVSPAVGHWALSPSACSLRMYTNLAISINYNSIMQ